MGLTTRAADPPIIGRSTKGRRNHLCPQIASGEMKKVTYLQSQYMPILCFCQRPIIHTAELLSETIPSPALHQQPFVTQLS